MEEADHCSYWIVPLHLKSGVSVPVSTGDRIPFSLKQLDPALKFIVPVEFLLPQFFKLVPFYIKTEVRAILHCARNTNARSLPNILQSIQAECRHVRQIFTSSQRGDIDAKTRWTNLCWNLLIYMTYTWRRNGRSHMVMLDTDVLAKLVAVRVPPLPAYEKASLLTKFILYLPPY